MKTLNINCFKIFKIKNSDKVCHFFFFFIITGSISIFFGVLIALGAAALIALLKEFMDQKAYGGFSTMDIVATLGGAFIAIALYVGVGLII